MEKQTAIVSLRLPGTMLKELARATKALGMSRSQVVRWAISLLLATQARLDEREAK